MTTWRIRLAASVIVVLLALGVALARHRYLQRRDDRVLNTSIEVGMSRASVIALLGEPDFIFGVGDLKRPVVEEECASAAASAVRYLISSSRGGRARTI